MPFVPPLQFIYLNIVLIVTRIGGGGVTSLSYVTSSDAQASWNTFDPAQGKSSKVCVDTKVSSTEAWEEVDLVVWFPVWRVSKACGILLSALSMALLLLSSGLLFPGATVVEDFSTILKWRWDWAWFKMV